jgi:hypothetical protein
MRSARSPASFGDVAAALRALEHRRLDLLRAARAELGDDHLRFVEHPADEHLVRAAIVVIIEGREAVVDGVAVGIVPDEPRGVGTRQLAFGAHDGAGLDLGDAEHARRAQRHVHLDVERGVGRDRQARRLAGDVPLALGVREPTPGLTVVEGDVVLVPRALAVIELHATQHLERATRQRALVTDRDQRGRVRDVGDLAQVLEPAIRTDHRGTAVFADLGDGRADAELD